MNKILGTMHAFVVDDDGIALTEYLILLSILLGGVITAVTVSGQGMATAWGSWATFWDDLR